MTEKQQLTTAQDSPPTERSADQLLTAIVNATSNPDVDVDKFERLLAAQERLQHQANEVAFNRAMVEAQMQMRRVSADAVNDQTRSKYATYAALDRAVRPIYTQYGFGISFDTEDAPGASIEAPEVRVVAYISHRDGHTAKRHIDMPADGKGAKGGAVMTRTHATASAVSYGMRYLLKMIFNIATGEDDDGNGAGSSEPVEYIDDSQISTLRDLIDATGANEANFLRACLRDAYYPEATLEDIPVSKYQAAHQRLRDRYNSMKEGQK